MLSFWELGAQSVDSAFGKINGINISIMTTNKSTIKKSRILLLN